MFDKMWTKMQEKNTLGVQVVETICARKSPWTGSALCHIMGFLICNFSPNCYFHDDRCRNLHKILPRMLFCYNIDASICICQKTIVRNVVCYNNDSCYILATFWLRSICICQTTIVRNVVWYNLKLWPFHTIYGWGRMQAMHFLFRTHCLHQYHSYLSNYCLHQYCSVFWLWPTVT